MSRAQDALERPLAGVRTSRRLRQPLLICSIAASAPTSTSMDGLVPRAQDALERPTSVNGLAPRDGPPRRSRQACRAVTRTRKSSLRACSPRIGERVSISASRSQISGRNRSGARRAAAASRALVPSFNMVRPSAVMRMASSSAPRRISSSRACASAPAGGASSHGSASVPRLSTPHAASSSARPDSSAWAISVRRDDSRRLLCGHSRYAVPGATRPARPAR